ncbi:hypothetical protein AMTRI_Chr03g53210 [Amborella trichopoda]
MNNFNHFILSNGLIDMNLVDTEFTWTNNSDIRLLLSRIDRFFINNSWDSLFPKAFVKALPHMFSDHVLN